MLKDIGGIYSRESASSFVAANNNIKKLIYSNNNTGKDGYTEYSNFTITESVEFNNNSMFEIHYKSFDKNGKETHSTYTAKNLIEFIEMYKKHLKGKNVEIESLNLIEETKVIN